MTDGQHGNTLDGIVTSALTKRHEERERVHPRDQSVYHDSSAGACLRQRVLKRTGAVVAAPQADDLRNFAFGHMVHELIQEALLSIGAIPIIDGVPMRERKIVTENGSGTYDCLVDLDHDGQLSLVDIKTCSVFAFQHLRDEGAKWPHQLQVCRYWLKLKDQFPIKDVRIFYLEKDKGFSREFGIPMSEELVRATLEDMTAEQQAWMAYQDKQALPERIAAGSPDAWSCNYCALYAACGEREFISKFSPTFNPDAYKAFKKGGAK